MELNENKQFSLLSYEITKNLPIHILKNNGIYFTPQDIVKLCLQKIKTLETQHNINIQHILEPCCGSCEFILSLDDCFQDKQIYALENNDEIYNKIKDIKIKNNQLHLNHIDFFKMHNNNNNNNNNNNKILKKYDLIIGNPPYYVLNKNKVDEKYHKYFDGRPNIFVLFLIDCLKKLNPNGLLCFVLPNNFMNCIYYDKARKYIINNYTIVDLKFIKHSKFLNTAQDVFILIIHNQKPNKSKSQSQNQNQFILNVNSYIIFNEPEKIIKLNKILEGCTNLNKLNFKISVGNVIWNENKLILTEDESKTLLIYSGNIENNELVIKKFKNDSKKNYINKEGINDMCIVINRGYGVGNYKLNYALIDLKEKKYLIENHLLIIKYAGTNKTNEELRILYNKILDSLNNEKTGQFMELYFENNALNSNELLNILPIFIEN
jgi:tRNA1(Val) A37 N6-methylase TrmN6